MGLTGSTAPVHSIKACVVYDAASGKIHHSHRVLTLEGGREPPAEEIAADALRAVAGRRSPPGGTLEVLHVDPAVLEDRTRYRVDLEGKRLVAG